MVSDTPRTRVSISEGLANEWAQLHRGGAKWAEIASTYRVSPSTVRARVLEDEERGSLRKRLLVELLRGGPAKSPLALAERLSEPGEIIDPHKVAHVLYNLRSLQLVTATDRPIGRKHNLLNIEITPQGMVAVPQRQRPMPFVGQLTEPAPFDRVVPPTEVAEHPPFVTSVKFLRVGGTSDYPLLRTYLQNALTTEKDAQSKRAAQIAEAAGLLEQAGADDLALAAMATIPVPSALQIELEAWLKDNAGHE